MRKHRVVVLAPLLDDNLRVVEAVEDVTVSKLVWRFVIEAFAISILPWRAGLDVEVFSSDGFKPVAKDLRGHLRPKAHRNWV